MTNDEPSVWNSVAHDLRTPLSVIKAQAQLLARRLRGDASAMRSLRAIEAQVERLTRTVENLVQVARIERGSMDLVCERVDLAEMVRRESERIEPAVELAAPDTLPIDGDRARLTLLVDTLLAHAARHSVGRAPIAIEARAIDGHVQLTVHDGGHDARHLDDRVSQVPEHPGRLGIGLGVARTIVEAHGGSISIAPDDAGVAIRVKLPKQRVR